MKIHNLKYTYNNEVLCALSIYHVLLYTEYLTFAKAALIPPLIFNNKLINYLNRNTIVRGIDELMIKKGDILANFNNQYTNFLPLVINSLTILEEIGVVSILDDKIQITDKSFSLNNIGKRAEQIKRCSKKIVTILDEKTSKLYLRLKVVL